MNRILPAVTFIVVLLGLWELGIVAFSIPEYLLPSPSTIVSKMMISQSIVLPHLAITALEAIIGFVLGAAVGVVLGTLFVCSRTLEHGIYPYAIALKSVPIVALAPLLVVWFGNGLLPKVLVASIISFFPVVVNSVKGLRNIDSEVLEVFESLSASKWQIFFKLRIPNSLPYIFAALKISSTLAVIGAIVGEFAGSDSGLGYFILISSYRLETVDMFVGIVLSSLLGIAFFYSIALAERLLVPWDRKSIHEGL